MLGDVVKGDGCAESRNVAVIVSAPFSSPGVICAGDSVYILVDKLPVGSVHHEAQLSSIDEQHFVTPFTPCSCSPRRLIPVQEPQGRRNRGRIEQLSG